MQKIININGQQYTIDSIVQLTQEQENSVIQQLSGNPNIKTAGCSSCGGLATTQPTINRMTQNCILTKTVGSILTLTAAPSGGTAPWYVVFKVNGVTISSQITSLSAVSTTHQMTSTFGATYICSVTITDSCSTPSTISETCTVTASAATPVLSSITISPSGTTVLPVLLKVGQTQQFTATCNDGAMSCPTLTWKCDPNYGKFSTTTPGLYEATANVTPYTAISATATNTNNVFITSNISYINITTACTPPSCSFNVS